MIDEDNSFVNIHEKNVEIESKINNLTKKVKDQISMIKN